MLLLVITKYLIALTTFIMLLIDETNAQLIFRSFSNNIAGPSSLNNNANGGALPGRQANVAQQNQVQQNPWLSAIGAGVQGFLAGSLFGSSIPSQPSYVYGGYPYYGGYYYYYPYYYRRYPYYYYYYG
ncbi:hypothetical protein WUBG_14076 [Wuchereria bancrofti]|uniref:Uncharacterized protein n=1 Tax=Wuchereria bancrofti TaxID=6293 RepID=J9AL85_WUCBA|nr:hypothetical protein WUBG_14076 [Wuchereria bancrofti]